MPEEQLNPHERIAEVKRRANAGPAILQNSFRPFFMAAGFWATLAVPLWVLTFFGVITVPVILTRSFGINMKCCLASPLQRFAVFC